LNQVVIHQLIPVTEIHLNHVYRVPARTRLSQGAVKNSLARRKIVLQRQSPITRVENFRQRKKFVDGQSPIINQLPLRLSAFGKVIQFFFA
jgi:hypothetical protein